MQGTVRNLQFALWLFLLWKPFTAQSPDRVAVVNGENISALEVERAAAGNLAKLELRRAQFELQLRRDRESALDDALERLLRSRVLAAEAASRKISIDELISIEVDAAIPPPADEAIVQFYTANQLELHGSLSDNVAAIRDHLKEQERQEIYEAFVTGLKKRYGAKGYREPFRVPMTTEGHPSKGPDDAPVTVVEFSDFECPYCGALFPTLRRIASDYATDVRIVYFQFPLIDLHPHAGLAAEASLCAWDQDRFWEMHDSIFSDQLELTSEELKRRAGQLNLDEQAFSKCLASGRHKSEIQRDLNAGAVAGVSGTPALFINGRLLLGNHPYEEIRKIIDDELQRASLP